MDLLYTYESEAIFQTTQQATLNEGNDQSKTIWAEPAQ